MRVGRLLLTVAALSLAGCTCARRERPVVTAIDVDAFEGAEVVSMSVPELSQMLRRGLERSRLRVLEPGAPAPKDAAGWRVTAALAVSEPDVSEGPTSRVDGVLQLHPAGDADGWEVRAVRESTPGGEDVDAIQLAAREALEATVRQLTDEAAALLRLSSEKNDVLATRLVDTDEALSRAALQVLVRRHDARVLPVLRRRLETDDLTQLRQTVGLLIELRDAAAVPALIEASRRKDDVVQREIVFALGALGGDEAEAYLDMVATGHDDPLVRASAEQALSELRERSSHEGARP